MIARALARPRALIARVPRAAFACAIVATVNAACWAVITPTFWVPDEPAHVGYVQQVAELGKLPSQRGTLPALTPTGLAEEQSFVYGSLPFAPEGRPSWSRSADAQLQRVTAGGKLERTRPGQAVYIGNNPPLYYLLEALPYKAFQGASFLDRLFAMRLFSALFGGLTVFFVFLFLRELLPRTSWAWTVGALVVAFQPVLGFISGGVNNDSLVYAASAAVFFGVARAFRKGLTAGSGALIGLAFALGLLTKPTVAGLVPGVALGLAVLIWRAPRDLRLRAMAGAGAAALTTLLPSMLWILGSRLGLFGSSDPSANLAAGASGAADLEDKVAYVWQALLPPLPSMEDMFPLYPPWEIFFKGFIGRFGWFQYGFSDPWYVVALVIFAIVGIFAGLALVRQRPGVSGRISELLIYVAMAGGLVVALELVAYGYHQALVFAYFEQARYLFPLLPLYGALVAVAARGAGRRWGPALGAFLVVLSMSHSLSSQLLSIARFYS